MAQKGHIHSNRKAEEKINLLWVMLPFFFKANHRNGFLTRLNVPWSLMGDYQHEWAVGCSLYLEDVTGLHIQYTENVLILSTYNICYNGTATNFLRSAWRRNKVGFLFIFRYYVSCPCHDFSAYAFVYNPANLTAQSRTAWPPRSAAVGRQLTLYPMAARQLQEPPREKGTFVPFPFGKGTGKMTGLLAAPSVLEVLYSALHNICLGSMCLLPAVQAIELGPDFQGINN